MRYYIWYAVAFVIFFGFVFSFARMVPKTVENASNCDDVCFKQNRICTKTWERNDTIYCVCDLTTTIVPLIQNEQK